MKAIGLGVREIRIREPSGAFRVIYLATLADRVLVLHAFQKKGAADRNERHRTGVPPVQGLEGIGHGSANFRQRFRRLSRQPR